MWELPLDLMRGHSVFSPLSQTLPQHTSWSASTPTQQCTVSACSPRLGCMSRLWILNCILGLNRNQTTGKNKHPLCAEVSLEPGTVALAWVYFVSLEPGNMERTLLCIGVVPGRSFSRTHDHCRYTLCIEELWLPRAREKTSMNMCAWCLCPLLLPAALPTVLSELVAPSTQSYSSGFWTDNS